MTPYVSLHPITPENPLSQTDWDSYTLHHKIRASKRSDIVSTTLIEGYGVYEETDSDFVRLEGLDRKVALLRIENGGHDIGRVEGVQDTIGRLFGFF